MSDKTENLESLLVDHIKTLDRVTKMAYLSFISAQNKQERDTPTAIEFGSYEFNPTNSATQLADWRQLVPRNPRRKRIVFSAVSMSYYFSNKGSSPSITELINWQNIGLPGSAPVALLTFGLGIQSFPMETTAPIYAASIIGAGSVYEQKGIINWWEEVYADTSANPMTEHDEEEVFGDMLRREGIR